MTIKLSIICYLILILIVTLKIMSCLNRQIVIIVASNMRRAQKYVERMKTATGYDTGPIVKK